MLLHVWVGLIHLLSPEQFPLGQCGRLVLAISPTEPVKCPAQTESFHDLIGLRFFEGGWQISLMSDIKLNAIKIHEFYSRFYEWILFVIGFGGLVSKGHLPLWQAWATQTAHMQGIVKTWCALKVPAIFGRSQETTKSTFVLEVEDTHCRHRRWSMIPWFHDVQDFFKI